MLRHPIAYIAIVAFASSVIVACSSSDPTSSPEPATKKTAGSGGTGGASAGAGGSGGSSATGGTAGEGGTDAQGGSGPEPEQDASAPEAAADTGACTNQADMSIINDANTNVTGKVQDCASQSMGGEPDTRNCIKAQTGMSDACVDCFDGAVVCTVKNCMMKCAMDSEGQACTSCRAQYCDPVFETCSGLPAN